MTSDGCVVKKEKRWVKITQLHTDLGYSDARLRFTDGRETETERGFKYEGGNWRVGGWSVESESRATQVGADIDGNAKHKLIFAEYRFYKTKYYQSTPDGYQFYYEWTPHNFTGERLRLDPLAEAASYFDNREFSVTVRSQDGPDWVRQSNRNKMFEDSFNLAGLQLSSVAGFVRNTRIEYEKGSCNAENRSRYLFGNRKDPAVAPVVYAFSYCI